MIAARSAADQQDVYQILWSHGAAAFMFGMLAINVWQSSEHLTAQTLATVLDTAKKSH